MSSKYQAKQNIRKAAQARVLTSALETVNSLPDVHRWEYDNEDHILVSPNGVTPLGRALTLTSGEWVPNDAKSEKDVTYLPFTMQFLGQFNSIDGLVYWMHLQDFPHVENFRKVTGKYIYQLKREALESGFHLKKGIPNVRSIIAMAMMERIVQNDVLLNAFKSNTLPLDAYEVNNDGTFRRVVPLWCNRWSIPILNTIKKCLDKHGVPQRIVGDDGITQEFEGFNPMYWRDADGGLFEGVVAKYQINAARDHLARQMELQRIEDEHRAAEMQQQEKAKASVQVPAGEPLPVPDHEAILANFGSDQGFLGQPSTWVNSSNVVTQDNTAVLAALDASQITDTSVVNGNYPEFTTIPGGVIVHGVDAIQPHEEQSPDFLQDQRSLNS